MYLIQWWGNPDYAKGDYRDKFDFRFRDYVPNPQYNSIIGIYEKN